MASHQQLLVLACKHKAVTPNGCETWSRAAMMEDGGAIRPAMLVHCYRHLLCAL